MLPTREQAQSLLSEHVKDSYQIAHSNMVALAMEAWAKKLNLDIELWYITGLLHDLDYFEFPEEHPKKSLEWFREWGYPEELIIAVSEHAFMRTGVEVKSLLGSALIACDELSGFIYAYSLMRPQKYEGMDAAGVKKRLKDKAFAAKIDRSDIELGITKFAEHLGKNVEEFKTEHINLLIEVFKNLKLPI